MRRLVAGVISCRSTGAAALNIEIVRKFAGQASFVMHPYRSAAKWTFAWIKSNRRLPKDVELIIKSATTRPYSATIHTHLSHHSLCLKFIRYLSSTQYEAIILTRALYKSVHPEG